MAFFYFSKYQFLSVLLLSYTFFTSLLITRCSPSNIAIFGTANSDLNQLQLLEKTNSFLAETKLNIESQRHFSYTLDCANEDSFQENTLNLNKHLKEEKLKNTEASSVFGIRITNPTSECEQQLANILEDMNLIPLYETSPGQKSENDQGDIEVFVVFNANEQQQKPQFDRENNNFDISKINVMQQGVEAGDIGIVLVVLILLGLAAAGVVIFIRRKKKKAQKKQLKVEKQKFIPRLQLSSQAPFNGQKEAGSKPSSTKKNKNLDVPKILSPTGRHAHALRLEDNHQSSIINDNIFTNLDNSPRSVDDDSDIQSVKNTPKDIGFNIEFSMIEQDSKIKSARDHEE